MPVWEVSEPYIDVWLYDKPLEYQPGLGERISFKLAYKQRDPRDFYDGVSGNYTGVGPLWHSSWVSYLYQSFVITTNISYGDGGTNITISYTTNMLDTATVVMADGGTRSFTANGSTPEYYSRGVMARTLDTNGYWKECVITYPDASKEVYDVVTQAPLLVGDSQVLYRTAKIDPFGNATRFYYQASQPLLQYVVDPDGRTNTLSYTGSLITQVQDPFGRTATLKYNAASLLTNVTDAIGMNSSFTYDSAGQLTNLSTPYGETGFEYFTGEGSPDDPLMNGVRVNDAVNGTNVYIFNEYTPFTTWRSSCHWGPKQAVNLPANLNTLASNAYNNGGYQSLFTQARIQQWYHDYRNSRNGTPVSQLLYGIWAPSNDTNKTFETIYIGRLYVPDSIGGGFDPYPSDVSMLSTDTGSDIEYNRDLYGRITNTVEFNLTDENWIRRTNTYVYDANGVDLLAHIGPEGELVAGYAYNSQHQIIRLTNALNEVTSYKYDTKGRWVSTATPAGMVTTNIYYDSGPGLNFVQTTIDLPIGRTNTYSYTNDLVYTHVNERGLAITNTWDGLNRRRRVDYPDGTYITNSYDRLDLVQVRDRMGYTNLYAYDPVRRLVAVTNALGYSKHYNYCSCGSLDSVLDEAGNSTAYGYDAAGRVTSETSSDGYTLYYTYDELGNKMSMQDSGGVSETYQYNSEMLVDRVNNAAGTVSLKTFDIEDRPTNTVDINGVSVNITYDLLGRVLTRSYPDGGVESFGYSFGISGPTSYTNQIGQVTRYAYDAAGRKTAETNALNYATLFNYNPAGDLLWLTDGNGHTTTWRYDLYGRATNKWDAAGNLLFVYGYDADNRLTNRWSAAKGNTAYAYDPVGNLTRVAYPVSPAITLKYDALNRLTNMVDAVGTTVYGYDTVGELLSEDGPWSNDTVSYHYQNRLRTGLSVPSSDGPAWAEGYGYDLARRLTSVSSYAGVFSYAYDPVALQQVDQLNLSRGAYITNVYDSSARLTGTWLMNSGGTNLDSYAYGYNQANQRTNVVRAAGDYVNYIYDNIGELTSSTGYDPTGSLRLHEHLLYNYDAAGNMSKKRTVVGLISQTLHGVNALNQITNSQFGILSGGLWQATLPVSGSTTFPANSVTVNGASASLYGDNTFSLNATVTNGINAFTAIGVNSLGVSSTNTSTVNVVCTNIAYAYDLNGNLLTDGKRGFAYDDENQLISVWKTNVWRNDFVYDGKMRRRIARAYTWTNSAWAQTNEVHYIYDGNLVVQERDASNTSLVSYTRGRDLSGSLQGAGGIGGLLARTDHGGQAYRSWYVLKGGADTFNYTGNAYYHCDGNGNVTCLINPSQTVVAKYLYDPFGNTLAQSGPLAEANTCRFSSKEWNANSGLYYYLYRFYDPTLQRWLNRDPIQEFGGVNLYEFVDNDSEDYSDAFGFLLLIGNPVIEEPIFDPIIRPISIPIRTFPKPPVVPVPKPTPPLRPPVIPPQCPGNDSHDDECKKQWADARKACAAELAEPHPDRGFTGGHTTVDGCAKGHVSEDCGGNPVPPPPQPPLHRRWRPTII
jgi:RHS repeat-associated protein